MTALPTLTAVVGVKVGAAPGAMFSFAGRTVRPEALAQAVNGACLLA